MKVKKPKKIDKQQASNEDVENSIAMTYASHLLQIMKNKGCGEFEGCKKVITTEAGGVYLLQVQHVCGPKIDCQKLGKL